MADATWKSDAAPTAHPRATRSLAALAIAAAPLLAAWHLAMSAGSLAAAGGAAALAALCALALGVLAADLVTGTVHWACDTWGDEGTPWLGPSLIRAFREHHRDPEAMLAHDWIEVNAEPAAAAALAYAGMALPVVQPVLREHPFAYAFLWSLIGFAALANQLHQWAHAPVPPAWARALQCSGLLSPERHARHHRPPYTGAYCITSGLLNPPLDAIGYWRGLERAVTRLTGRRPRAATGGDTASRAA